MEDLRTAKRMLITRAKNEGWFRQEMVVRAAEAAADGEFEICQMMSLCYFAATGSLVEISRQIGKQKSAIAQMLGHTRKPTLKDLLPIIVKFVEREGLAPHDNAAWKRAQAWA